MNTQHTPATWYQRPTGSDQNAVASENTGETIAVVYHDNEANARLIAAAPDMLSVLIEAVEHTRAYDTNPALVELFKRVISNATTQNT